MQTKQRTVIGKEDLPTLALFHTLPVRNASKPQPPWTAYNAGRGAFGAPEIFFRLFHEVDLGPWSPTYITVRTKTSCSRSPPLPTQRCGLRSPGRAPPQSHVSEPFAVSTPFPVSQKQLRMGCENLAPLFEHKRTYTIGNLW